MEFPNCKLPHAQQPWFYLDFFSRISAQKEGGQYRNGVLLQDMGEDRTSSRRPSLTAPVSVS